MGISSIKIAGPEDQLPLQVLSFLLASSLFYVSESSRRVLTGGLDFAVGGWGVARHVTHQRDA